MISAEALTEIRGELDRWRRAMAPAVRIDRRQVDRILARIVCDS